jgi:hypothetical protein
MEGFELLYSRESHSWELFVLSTKFGGWGRRDSVGSAAAAEGKPRSGLKFRSLVEQKSNFRFSIFEFWTVKFTRRMKTAWAI